MSDQLRRIAGLSPEKQALLMRRLKREGNVARRPQIRPQGRAVESFPLSYAQQRLWFLNQLQPDSTFYNVPDTYRLTGRLDARVLEHCFDALVRRHETLRTTFKMVGGEPRQFINDPARFTLEVLDLTRLPVVTREAEALRLAEEEAARLFDLTRDPMLRARLLRLGEEEHLLLMSMHHIASDGWSRGILAGELMKLYEAYSEGREAALEPLPIQYADYAVWQREYLTGEVLAEQLSYWRDQLGGELPVLELPTDRPRPPMPTYSGAYYQLEFPKKLGAALSALGRESEATLYMVLLAAFDALLHRYTGQDDIVVGTPIAGRNRREVEGLIGFFVNTLVMRTGVEGTATFRELLGRVREATLGAYAHQEVPFEKLVEELHPKRDLSRNPLFQVAFALQNAPTQDLALRGLSMTALDVGSGASRFDLEVHIWEEEDEGLGGFIVYSTDLFEEASIARLHAHYLRLLGGIVADPDARISKLPLLTEAERRQLLYDWNDTRREYPRDSCIHELFEAQAARTPGAVALVCGEQRVTYGELNCRADGLSRRLLALGVGPEVAVGLYTGRTVEMVVGLLGILKAGGAYVPLDPDYPHERIAFILADTQAGVLLTEERLLGEMPPHESKVICLDREWAQPVDECAAHRASQTTEANLAYIIYTSGSTGRPKGVCITHASVVTLLHWARESFSAGELQGVLAATSICFDLSAFELFVPLSVGGKVILAENALALPTLPAADEVTLVNTVPSAMAELVRMSGVPRSVLCVNLAGERLKNSLAQQVYAQGGVRRVLNLYGPSEDTTYSTVASHARGATTEPTIGRPIANTHAYILDSRLAPVAIGVSGELYLGGEGLARGYLARPDLTAERFIPDPFGGVPGGRLYRTGDVARYLPSGELEFLGRADHQVKIRGFRIEPGEIEAVLSTHPAVSQVIVTTGEGVSGEKRLVAYVGGAETGASVLELQAFLRARLPQYMVPTVFVFLDALPLTPSGKVDRRRLPAPDGARPDGDAAYVAPRTPGEEDMAAIWREVLGVQRVGVYDDFFDLGGHSLLATRVISIVRERRGVEVPLRLMFESPTVEGIAAHVEASGRRQEELGRLTDVLDRLEQLTEEEVRALLERQAGEMGR
ncbi:MAG: amino acid adenylation domain-containing protein [Acidobacteria bacterium]|nr:amino acid adenylation domain-containing protein [Acidobacteriota bacterium]